MALHAATSEVEGPRFTLDEAAAITERINTTESLHERFVQIPSIYSKRAPGQAMVEIIEPSSFYAYGGVMVIAVDASVVDFRKGESDGTQKVSAKNIFAYEREVRVEYYRQILSCIQAEELIQLPDEENMGKKFPVVAFEQTTVAVSNRKKRLSRSVALSHTHVIKMGGWFDAEYKTPSKFGFRFEQKMLQNATWFEEFKVLLLESLKPITELSSGDVIVTIRDTVPFGYTISLRLSSFPSINQQALALGEVLLKHSAVYSDFAMEQVRKVDSNRELRGSSGKRPINGVIVPQPSYRTYIYYRPESLCVTISPVFMVPVGAVEALDIKVHRNPGNTHPYSSEEMQTFMSHLKSSITSILSD